MNLNLLRRRETDYVGWKQRRPSFIVTRIHQRVCKRVSDSIWRFSSYTPRTNARLTIKSGRKGVGSEKCEICFASLIFLPFQIPVYFSFLPIRINSFSINERLVKILISYLNSINAIFLRKLEVPKFLKEFWDIKNYILVEKSTIFQNMYINVRISSIVRKRRENYFPIILTLGGYQWHSIALRWQAWKITKQFRATLWWLLYSIFDISSTE